MNFSRQIESIWIQEALGLRAPWDPTKHPRTPIGQFAQKAKKSKKLGDKDGAPLAEISAAIATVGAAALMLKFGKIKGVRFGAKFVSKIKPKIWGALNPQLKYALGDRTIRAEMFTSELLSSRVIIKNDYIRFLRKFNPKRVIYVSGPISPSNGLPVNQNITNLRRSAERLAMSGNYDVVLNPAAIGDLVGMGYTYKDAMWIWEKVLKSRRIGNMAMVKGWQRSSGATQELKWAKEMKDIFTIKYLKRLY